MNRSMIWRKFSLLVGVVFATSLLVTGCGTDSYNESGNFTPTLTATPNALIEPATLKEWMDLGLVNAPADGSERVVILTVGTQTAYEVGHIPGALLWDSNNSAGEPAFSQTRVEGLAPMTVMVPDGANMDSLFRTRGIDGKTTIVISHSGTNMMNPSRAYFNLRYWGFPKAQIKVLNGGDSAWATAAATWGSTYQLTSDVPVVAQTRFSVRNIGVLRPDLRLSLGEMLQEVDRNLVDSSTVGYILDARGGTDYEATAIPTSYPMYAFQGRIANAIKDDHGGYYSTVVTTAFKPVGEPTDAADAGTLWARIKQLGVSNDKKIITYCVSGMRAAVPFFVIDGILGWDVTLYDGSWNQWGSYSDHYTTSGTPAIRTSSSTLVANSTPKDAWRTDKFGRSVVNSPAGEPISTNPNVISFRNSTLSWDSVRLNTYIENTDSRANQIENADQLYITQPPEGGANDKISGGGPASGC